MAVSLTAPTYEYTDRDWIEGVASEIGVTHFLDDDQTGSAGVTESAYLTDYIVRSSTEEANFYLSLQYPPSRLSTSYWVAWHTTIIALRRLFMRRGNPIPDSLESQYEETIEKFTLVKNGQAFVPGIKRRKPHRPAWSNVEVDFRYPLRRIRVQRPMSEPGTTRYERRASRWADRTYDIW